MDEFPTEVWLLACVERVGLSIIPRSNRFAGHSPFFHEGGRGVADCVSGLR